MRIGHLSHQRRRLSGVIDPSGSTADACGWCARPMLTSLRCQTMPGCDRTDRAAEVGLGMRAAKDDMAVELDVGDIHTKGEEWGELSVRYCDLPAGADLRPLLAALPGDHC